MLSVKSYLFVDWISSSNTILFKQSSCKAALNIWEFFFWPIQISIWILLRWARLSLETCPEKSSDVKLFQSLFPFMTAVRLEWIKEVLCSWCERPWPPTTVEKSKENKSPGMLATLIVDKWTVRSEDTRVCIQKNESNNFHLRDYNFNLRLRPLYIEYTAFSLLESLFLNVYCLFIPLGFNFFQFTQSHCVLNTT